MYRLYALLLRNPTSPAQAKVIELRTCDYGPPLHMYYHVHRDIREENPLLRLLEPG